MNQRFGAESQPEDEERTELYRRLLAVRKRVALDAVCNPYQVKSLAYHFKIVMLSLPGDWGAVFDADCSYQTFQPC